MTNKAVVSLTTGMEDPEKVTVAFLVAVAAAEEGRPTLMFLTKEAVRLAEHGVAVGLACDGCPALPELVARYIAAGGTFLVCPICFNAKALDPERLDRARRDRRHRPHVAMDRRRGRHHVQLLTFESTGDAP